MNNERNNEDLHKPEVQITNETNKANPKPKKPRARVTPPVLVNDLEDIGGYNKMATRHFDELPPANIQQEGDLITLTQLRWTTERLNSLIEREINHRVRMPHLQSNGDPGARLMMGYRLCLADKVFNLLANSISTRSKPSIPWPPASKRPSQTKPKSPRAAPRTNHDR